MTATGIDENTPSNAMVVSPSLDKNTHRRFANVEEYVKELGGDKARVIEKILIANNGVAAVKAIRSIRRWAYEIFGDERAIQFVVMATPEDLRANAEYIRMGDVIVDVPGGSNNHNYANVMLIVELARLHGVHAVWAGWGHASENPLLPDTLAQSSPPIKFIGPAGPPMRALGDKIGSTIIAQTAGVPCIAWNGDGVKAAYDTISGTLPDQAFDEASIKTTAEAQEAASRIGFPIMIKASEGGGGKGIRRVDHPGGVADAFRQVCGEVPGSPVFIMKLSSNSRHLEVQLLADEYGNAVALNGRDCSVQRRHQKIIEEGPPVAAPPRVWLEMERAAVSLAKAVKYTNAGTVEYLYNEAESKFYFLELNPRLQVEHPVTEMITRVNLPAAQLQVAMGLPLYCIPEIRELYGKKRFEDKQECGSLLIDFETESRVPPNGHCIAVRITAENAEAGFKPTSGGIQELNFRSTPSVWGYFSMDSSGSIHEFADSQFGHLFANGSDREQARRNMVLALKELSIRGDISTTVDYISKLIELDDFVSNRIDTSWLDGIIASNVGGMGMAESLGAAASVNVKPLHDHAYVLLGAIIKTYTKIEEAEASFLTLLEKGQLPPRSLLKMEHEVELLLSGTKYMLHCKRKSEQTFVVSVRNGGNGVQAGVRQLSDGGFLVDIGGTNHVAYLIKKSTPGGGMRMNVGGTAIGFSPDYDPSSLRTDVAGKLVKKLKIDGEHVRKGEVYCEIEVMKMFMPLKVDEAGTIAWKVNEGASLAAGDLLATLELDNPDNVAKVSVYEGELNVPGYDKPQNSMLERPHLMLRSAFEALRSIVSGYACDPDDKESAFSDLAFAATHYSLPALEVEEQLSALNGRIPANLHSGIVSLLEEYKKTASSNSGSGLQQRFPSMEILDMLSTQSDSFDTPESRASFNSIVTALKDAVLPFSRSKLNSVPGAERVMVFFLDVLRKWISIERWFSDGTPYSEAVEKLRKHFKHNLGPVVEICRAHEQLDALCDVMLRVIGAVADGSRFDLESSPASEIGGRVSIVAGAESLSLAMPVIAEIGALGGLECHANVALKARKVLLQESMPNMEQRKRKVRDAAITLSGDSTVAREAEELLRDHIPMADVIFPLLRSFEKADQQLGLVELYIRHLYGSYTLQGFQSFPEKHILRFAFLNKPSETALKAATSVSSMTDLSRIVSSGSLGRVNDDSESSEASLVEMQNKEKIPQSMRRTGVVVVLRSLAELRESPTIDRILEAFADDAVEKQSPSVGPVNVLYCLCVDEKVNLNDTSGDEKAKECHEILSFHKSALEEAGLRRVSVVFGSTEEDEKEFDDVVPALFTFRCPDFTEDTLFRQIDPSHAMHLDLNRLAENFRVKSLGSRHSSLSHVHLYEARPRSSALAKDKTANSAPRIFVRALSFVLDFSSSNFERILVDALNALDLCSRKGKRDNHVFLNLVSDIEKAVVDPVVAEQIVVDILNRHDDRVSSLGISEVETQIVCCPSADSSPISIRLVANNPTGYVQVMNTYVEAVNEKYERVFKLIGGTKASLASSGDSSWDGKKVDTAYPLTRPFDPQRRAALHASDTVYCYDIPALFEAACEMRWQESIGKDTVDGGCRKSSRPAMVMYTSELVVRKRGDTSSNTWTMQDYLKGDLELVQVHRGAGANDVGMVAWLVVMKTAEYPSGRQIVLLANDITFKAGSFGTREDVVFKLASEYARQHRVPRIFIAANSGARIGLSESVRGRFKVAFKEPSSPESGFEFLYLDKADFQELVQNGQQVSGVETDYNGQLVYRIIDIIGCEADLGVENLKGSGLIAGETSIAYEDIFTMTVVLGRTVGIGAYLVRLGQRTIQKSTSSPIILTGYQALNKLMGVDVYATNDQLGGPGIMYSNGISHRVEPDHLSAIKAAVDWLSFVPATRGGLLPITDVRGIDEVERDIAFSPQRGVPYNPRDLIAGVESDSGEWIGGFFDRGSFTEALAGWAKTVVIGRARLGGIPMGVIITENRTTENIKPADPADLKASESVIHEAGCVWFPNSAYKTAQAIRDFRTEDLPLIIFANWRGFSGGQRDMFDEVLKYGSLIVDAFVAYQQPVFVFIPPFGEIRGGAWVVLDSSINSAVMEMYATKGTARGGVLEANGLASVKYRTKDLLTTMHRLDHELISLDTELANVEKDEQLNVQQKIRERESRLLPVYEQIAIQFCDLHDTTGRMHAVGVIEGEIEWKSSRSFFYWRLRRKLAEFDLRTQIVRASLVGRGIKSPSLADASRLIEHWFNETPDLKGASWRDDKIVLGWMAERHDYLQEKILSYTRKIVSDEVFNVMTAGGNTARVGIHGIAKGIRQALLTMSDEEREAAKKALLDALAIEGVSYRSS